MTARLCMNPNPVFLRTSDTVARGAELILTKQRRSLPVVDEEDRYVGMFSANCLLYLVLPQAATMEQGLDSLPYVQNSMNDLRERLKKYLDKPVSLCLKQKDVAVVHPDTPSSKPCSPSIKPEPTCRWSTGSAAVWWGPSPIMALAPRSWRVLKRD